jgi:predicted Zn-dependent protease
MPFACYDEFSQAIMDPRELYVEATQAYIQGDKARARRLLDELVSVEPGNELAWLLLADAAPTPKEAEECLRKVLAINPRSAVAKRKLNKIQSFNRR